MVAFYLKHRESGESISIGVHSSWNDAVAYVIRVFDADWSREWRVTSLA